MPPNSGIRPSRVLYVRVEPIPGSDDLMSEEGKPGTLAAYCGNIERVMNFENDSDAGRRGEFEKQIKRGWFIDFEEFKERLDARLRGRSGNENYRGGQRRKHDVWEAERLWEKGLKELNLTEEEILESKSVRMEKQALAWLLKSHTAVTGKWLAERLRMSHPMNVSRAIERFRKAEGHEVKLMKSRMLKCVGPFSTPGPELESILRLVPKCNPEARIRKENPAGSLVEWSAGEGGRPLRFHLDPMGTTLLKQIDGRRPIDAYVERFAAEHRLTFLESSGLWAAYVRMRTRRNILNLEDPEAT